MNKQLITIPLGLILTGLILHSCVPASDDQIHQWQSPDTSLLSDFGIETNGEIVYQFYQRYGFTDIEEQLILILSLEEGDSLPNELPIDAIVLESMERISLGKYIPGEVISYSHEKSKHADIQLNSGEFSIKDFKAVFSNTGRYKVIKTDTHENVYIFDQKSGLMYIEAIK